MGVMYPKFSHARPLDTGNPGAIAPPRATRAGMRNSRELGTVSRLVLLAALVWGVNHAFQRGQDVEPDLATTMAAQFQSEAMLNMSEADASLLRSLPDRLEGACERNRYEPGQQACRTRLRQQGGSCLVQVAQQHPGQHRHTDRTAIIIEAYLHCVFDQ